jgi:hypothetical protein
LAWSRLSLVGGLSLLRADAFWRGIGLQAIGWGIIIQGGFLFLFDLYHALLLAEEQQA